MKNSFATFATFATFANYAICAVVSSLLLAAMPVAAQPPGAVEKPSLEQLHSGWNTLPSAGLCSTGTPYKFHVSPQADSSDLLLYLNGGGACWFAEACDLNSQPNVHSPFAEMDANDPRLGGGIFNRTGPGNPFAEFNIVFLPYCTGDVHIGAGPQTYAYSNPAGSAESYTAYHNGYANTMEVLDWLYANYPQVERVVVAGSSAGAIGAAFYAGMVAEHYELAEVFLLADGAGGYGSPQLSRTFHAWNTESVLPDWPEYAGLNNDSLVFEDFYIASARHNENLRIAQYNTAQDQVQIDFTLLLGDSPQSFTLPQRIFNNYLKIDSEVNGFYSYTAGGSVHTILRSPIFYAYKVDGVRFVDWVRDYIAGEPVGHISCVNLPEGCEPAPEQ